MEGRIMIESSPFPEVDSRLDDEGKPFVSGVTLTMNP